MNPVLAEIYRTGKTATLSGQIRRVTGGILPVEAEALTKLIVSENCKVAAETGVAFGLSTLAICDGLAVVPSQPSKLYGVDPCQMNEFDGAAIAALQRAKLNQHFELLEGSSHIMLPRLLEQGVRLDFAFIDGWHTFDYTFLDFFYFDKMLVPRGIIAIHDALWPSVARVIRFVQTHRRYETVPVGDVSRSLGVRVLSMLKSLVTEPRNVPVRTRELIGHTNLLVLRKIDEFEPPYSFYARF